MRLFYKIIASGCYTGHLPAAPGTWGSLLAAILFIWLGNLSTLPWVVTLITWIAIAIWVSDHAISIYQTSDPSHVVIDEIVGLWVALSFHPPKAWIIVTGFILFRFFDIVKPFPIRQIDEKIKGGIGIVLDDLLAGVYANIILTGIIYFVLYI